MADNDKKQRSSNNINALGFVWRFAAALVLVLLTYNPSGESAFHWVTAAIGEREFGPLYLLLIGVLLAGWVVFWIADLAGARYARRDARYDRARRHYLASVRPWRAAQQVGLDDHLDIACRPGRRTRYRCVVVTRLAQDHRASQRRVARRLTGNRGTACLIDLRKLSLACRTRVQ